MERMLSVGLALANAPYIKETITLNYDLAYFEKYLLEKSSDYYQFDNVRAMVNSQLLLAYQALYFAKQKKELEKLLAIRGVIGQEVYTFRSFFMSLLKAEVELQERIHIYT